MPTSFSELIQSEVLVLVDFHATWCGPCKMMKPILANLKQKLGDRIRIIQIDVDKNNELAQSLQVMGVPTLIIYKNGIQTWRKSGVVSESELEKLLL